MLVLDSQTVRLEANRELIETIAVSLAEGVGRTPSLPIAVQMMKRDLSVTSCVAALYAEMVFPGAKTFFSVPWRGIGVVEPLEHVVMEAAQAATTQ